MLADPRIARDATNPLVEAYFALFAPGASFPSTVVEGWVREADQGRFYQPGPAGVMRRSTVMSMTATSDDEVSFTICAQNSVRIIDEAGNPVEAQGGVQGGLVNAVRVNGVWLLRDLSQSSAEGCPVPGEGG
ncbi:MAG TPA: hypothetical protein VNQ73_02375 [Ilumatobacter sp.]|nr:hypothetical protein [Ilumatobacter sp.]